MENKTNPVDGLGFILYVPMSYFCLVEGGFSDMSWRGRGAGKQPRGCGTLLKSEICSIQMTRDIWLLKESTWLMLLCSFTSLDF